MSSHRRARGRRHSSGAGRAARGTTAPPGRARGFRRARRSCARSRSGSRSGRASASPSAAGPDPRPALVGRRDVRASPPSVRRAETAASRAQPWSSSSSTSPHAERGACLRGVPPFDLRSDRDVDGTRGAGVMEVLRGGPHERPVERAFECLHRDREQRPAVHRAGVGQRARLDLDAPVQRVVCRVRARGTPESAPLAVTQRRRCSVGSIPRVCRACAASSSGCPSK